MNTRVRFRFALMALILIVGLVTQSAAAMPAKTGSGNRSVQEAGGEIRQEVSLTIGEPVVRSEKPKSENPIQQTDKAIPSLDAPTAPPDPEKEAPREAPPSRDRGWNVLMTETFEGAFPNGLWNALDNNGANYGEYYWDDDDYLPHNGYWSAWPANGGANGVDPESYYYPNNMDSWMVYGPFDLSGCKYADFEFYYWNQSESNWDWFNWVASPNGSNFYGYGVSGDSGGWQWVDMDLSPYLGDTSVWLGLTFDSDSTNVDDGAFVDDVVLWCYTETTLSSWTYMVYLDGDNNLESAAIDDFLEMSSVGSDANVKIVAQVDRISGYDTSYDNWTDTRRFYITPGLTPAAANGTPIGEANMGHPETLLSFVRWAKAFAPANHYVLVLWDHGSGWRFRDPNDVLTKAIAYDDSSGGDAIDMPELRSTLNTLTNGGANPFDIVGLDACLMAMIEVDDQIRPYANIRVGSEETEPGDGWPHDTILSALKATPSMSATTLATDIVDFYYSSYGNNNTQSAVNLGSPYTTLNTAVNNLAVALMNNGHNYISEIQAARNNSQQFFYPYYIDLWDFADLVRLYVPEPNINNAAVAVKNAVTAAVIREHHGGSWPWARGISIYFPKTPGEYDARYDGSTGFLQFTANTQWDEWLHTYHNFANYPVMFNKSSPASGATGQSVSPTLSWGASAGATSYEVCAFDTSNDGICNGTWYNVGGNTNAYVNLLNEATTYYWQVRAINAYGSVYANTGGWWSFTTGSAPGAFNKSGPSNGATNLPLNPTLTWGSSSGATSYEYCYDTTNDNACSGWTNNGVSTSKALSGLSQNTTYYWHVRAWNAIGPKYSNGFTTAFWSFTTGGVPGAFNKTSPANGAVNQSTSPTLSWAASSSATGYFYCYDTNNNNACDGSWINNGTSTSASLSGLTSPTNYYWHVTAINSFGERESNSGQWWSFTTANTAPHFTSAPVLAGTVGQLYNYNITATDPDGDTMTIAAPTKPAWLTFTDNGNGTATLNGAPALSDLGANSVTLEISDSINLPVAQSFTINITNAPPVPEKKTFYSNGAQDGFILESSETSGLGGSMNSTATQLYIGDHAANKQYLSILSFDTSTLPDNAVITKVTLKFKHIGFTGTSPFSTHGNLLVDVRKGAFSNNVALQLGDFNASPTKFKVLAYVQNLINGWYMKSFLAVDFNKINKTGPTQFRLRFTKDDNNDLGADFLKIYSGNAGASNRPQLVIEYHLP